MKTKRNIFCAFALMASVGMYAQTQYDAARIIGSDLNGTARFVGMGGAMSALGGDISVISTNPAGIGIFRSSDVSTSFGFNTTSTKSDYLGSLRKDNKTHWSFDQVGFVYSNKIGNNTSLRYVNFGFNYHKKNNFNRVFGSGGSLNGMSQTWQMANMLGIAMDNYNIPIDDTEKEVNTIYNAKNPYTTGNQYPFMGIMGVRTDLIGTTKDSDTGKDKLIGWNGDSNKYTSREEGGIDEYDFNVAFNIEDRVYLGMTLGVYDVNYKRYSYYTEDISYNNDNGYYELTNWFHTKGSGVDLKLGVIVRPFEESPFRISLSVATPTWYSLTNYSAADMSSNVNYVTEGKPTENVKVNEYTPDYTDGDIIRDYKLITPWKFNVSLGTTLLNIVAVGAEYEYQDYSSAKFQYNDGDYMTFQNSIISEDLKGVNTLRLGMEAKLFPQFSIRAGYNYSSSVFKNSAYKALDWNSMSTSTEFNNVRERNTFTFGVGYKGSIFYADLAYKYDTYKSNFYAFDDAGMAATKVDNNYNQLLFTMGMRF